MDSSTHIRVLPVHVANKIAAGEVVDRPASVLKELMENAVDAGATRIDVDIVAGGRKLVAVSDNGPGMNRDDAILSIERHATSKIRDVDDIERIGTLGFRGEALAAIASVSRFRLTTCRAGDDSGTEILITGGKLQDVRDAGCPVGTVFEVRDLFLNVPARRKFLRSHQTELSHVRAAFIVQAMAHPETGMGLKVDGRETYSLAEGSSLTDRLHDLFGSDYRQNLEPVDHKTGEVAVSGYVSLPSVTRSDRNEQYIFVNGRAVSAPLLGYAVREGYHTLLPNKRHPSVFLFLDMDPGLVDVNVHPTKKEVRFRHPGEVRDAVIEAIRQALASDATPSAPAEKAIGIETDQAHQHPVADTHLKIQGLPVTRGFKYPGLGARGEWDIEHPIRHGGNIQPMNQGPQADTVQGGHRTEKEETIDNQQSAIGNSTSPWTSCRVLGQIGSLYVVLETEDGFVLMDPHAAHERVLFERFMADVLNGKVQTQSLLMPETVELGPKDAMRVRKNLDLFKELGFGISEFGGDAFVVDALPSCFSRASAKALLVEIAHDLEQAGTRRGKGRWREESIVQAACKSAVKARDKLDLEEIEQLVVDLAGTEMPYTCPHGRPTLIFTSFKELNRKFGRE